MTGVEGYVESAATGLMVARTLAAELAGGSPPPPPQETAMGGLVRHLTERSPHGFQPANISWGLIATPPELAAMRSRRERRERHALLAVGASGTGPRRPGSGARVPSVSRRLK
jgi:methylenetetrahydrofolate--tRNA-(uracil-5-)-methyltransferase